MIQWKQHGCTDPVFTSECGLFVIYDPRRVAPKRPPKTPAQKLAARLAGLARLGSDVLGERATDAAAILLRQAAAVKRSA